MSAALQPPELKAPAAKRKRRLKQRRKSGLRGINRTDLLVGGPTKVAIATGKVARYDWADPDDHDAQKRTPRIITGYRASDSLTVLLGKGCIGRHHAAAGWRFRRSYEAGVLGLTGSALGRLGTIRSTSPDAGPSESRVAHLERYENARGSLGRLYDVASGVIEADLSVKAYSARFSLSASVTLGRLISALDILRDHYEGLDKLTRKKAEAGSG